MIKKKKNNVAIVCDVLPKVGKAVSRTRKRLSCVELNHQDAGKGTKDKEHGDFHSGQGYKRAGSF